MSGQRMLGIASIAIAVISAFVQLPALANPAGVVIAAVGLSMKGRGGRRGLDWTCYVGLALNALAGVLIWAHG